MSANKQNALRITTLPELENGFVQPIIPPDLREKPCRPVNSDVMPLTTLKGTSMHIALPIFAIAALLSACAIPQPNTPEKSAAAASRVEVIDQTEGCSVYVYRNKTSFHRFNPEKPYVYVGEERVGRLGVGDSICLRMPDGKYNVSIKEPIAFVPTYTSGKLDIEVLSSTPVYVRYAKDFAGVVVSGSNATVTGSSKLQMVGEKDWRDRL
jgi:hypothetical protein